MPYDILIDCDLKRPAAATAVADLLNYIFYLLSFASIHFCSPSLPLPQYATEGNIHSPTASVLICAGGSVCVCVVNVSACWGYVLLAGIGFRLEDLSIPLSLCLRVCVCVCMGVGLPPAEK